MTTMLTKFAAAASALALSFAAPVLAQDAVMPATAPVASEPVDGPALWRLSDEDTTIYLFGTIHILPKDTAWKYERLETALASADTFVSEVGDSAEVEAQMLPLIQQLAMLPEGETLRGLMDEGQRAVYEEALNGLGIPAAAFDQFEPWFATINLSVLPLLQQGYSPDSGVEKALEAMLGENVEQIALETAEQQLRIFDSLPMDTQLTYLTETAAEIDTIVPMLNEMVTEWAAGDADGLAQTLNDSMSEDPVLAEALLYARNRSWADWIQKRMDTPGTVFIAVGAGHLAGDKSVQDVLEDRGMEVVRVN